MRKTKDTNRKIWVKRIWVEKEEYDYLNMSIEQYERTLEGLEFNIKRRAPEQIRIEKASRLYSMYRTSKPNLAKGILFIGGAVVGAIITELIHLFFK